MGQPIEMSFNTDPSKQVYEVIFSSKTNVTAHRQLVFNNNPYIKHQLKSILEFSSISS